MAHTYVISSATTVNDLTTVTGTVDGIPCTITVWHSALTKLANTTAVQNFLAPLMLAAAIPSVTADILVPVNTFSQ